MSVVTEASATNVTSEVVVDRASLRVIRLELPPGEGLPTHAAPTDLVIVVIEGTGRLSIGGRVLAVEPGTIVALAPGERHAIDADERLKFALIQATLAATVSHGGIAAHLEPVAAASLAGRRKGDAHTTNDRP